MSNWYYADPERQRQGPLTAEELVQRFHQGRLRLDTAFLIWRMDDRTGVGRYDVLRRSED